VQNELFIYVGDNKIGIILILQDIVLSNFGIKNKEVVAAEIYLNKVFSQRDLKNKFVALPVYPGITRDVSLVVNEKIKAEDILSVIKENAGVLLREVNVVDYYKGKQISADAKGLTITCLYRSDERTLNDTEINPLHSSVCEKLTSKFSAKIR
jgi:phenylalanyl-tRNA synthetase beta chain